MVIFTGPIYYWLINLLFIFIDLIIHLFNNLFIHLINYSFIYLFIQSLIYSFIYLFIYCDHHTFFTEWKPRGAIIIHFYGLVIGCPNTQWIVMMFCSFSLLSHFSEGESKEPLLKWKAQYNWPPYTT